MMTPVSWVGVEDPVGVWVGVEDPVGVWEVDSGCSVVAAAKRDTTTTNITVTMVAAVRKELRQRPLAKKGKQAFLSRQPCPMVDISDGVETKLYYTFLCFNKK
jgi:hypothetical protein